MLNELKLILDIRKKISLIDETILYLLAERNKLSLEVGKAKLFANNPVRDIYQEQYLLKHLIKLANFYKLDVNYISNIFKLIIRNSIFTQNSLYKHL